MIYLSFASKLQSSIYPLLVRGKMLEIMFATEGKFSDFKIEYIIDKLLHLELQRRVPQEVLTEFTNQFDKMVMIKEGNCDG